MSNLSPTNWFNYIISYLQFIMKIDTPEVPMRLGIGLSSESEETSLDGQN